MALKFNNQNVTSINFNGNEVKKLVRDGTIVWEKPFTLTVSPATGSTLSIYRYSTNEPTASSGSSVTLVNGDTIYYEDVIYITAANQTGYTGATPTSSTGTISSNKLTVDGNETISTTVSRISGTISQGTLPTGVGSIKCYRKAWNGSGFSEYTGSTIYYGDQFYWTATAATGYNAPTLTYYDSSHVYTWTGSQGGSITSVGASGVQGTSFNVTINKNTGVTSYSYSYNNSTWTDGATAATQTVSIGTTLYVKCYGTSSGYNKSTNVQNTTTPTTITISPASYVVTISRSTGVATYAYKIGSGSYTTGATAATQTVTYGSSITVYPATASSGYTVNTSATQTASAPTTLTLNPATCTLTLTKNTGVDTIYYKVNGASSWSSTTSSTTVSFNFNTTIYWYATGSTYYTRNDSYTSSSSYATISNQKTSTTVSPTSTRNTNTITVTKNTNVSNISLTYYNQSGTQQTVSSASGAYTAGQGYGYSWSATAETGYGLSSSSGSGTVTSNITIAPTASRLSYTYTQSSITNVASQTCYRAPWNNTGSYSTISSGATIYYGDRLYWAATASTGYNAPTVSKNSTSNYLTVTGNVASSSYITAGSRQSFTITFSNTSYGTWSNGSGSPKTLTAYYGDKITRSGNTVTCYKWDATSTARWTNTLSANATTNQYTYSATASGSDIASVTSAATFGASSDRTERSYTVTLSATNGSWSKASITAVYSATISRSGNTLTVGSTTATYTPFATTVSTTAGSVTYTNDSGTVGTGKTVTAVTATSTRLYTIQWLAANGSTVLETDSNVAYDAVLTYNGSTPTKSSTDQYTYSFSGWKLGSTAITSGTSKNPGSTSTTTLNIQSQFSSTERSYNVTFANGIYGGWDSTATISATYSTAITIDGNKVTVGSTTRTYSNSAIGYSSSTTVKVGGSTSNTTVGTGKAVTVTATRSACSYTLIKTLDNATVNWYNNSGTEITSADYGTQNLKCKVTPNSYYETTVDGTRYYYGNPITLTGITLNNTNFTLSNNYANGNATYKSFPTISAITYTVTMSLTNAAVKINTAASSYAASLSKTNAQLDAANIYYQITPNNHYGMTYNNTWYYKDKSLSGSSYYVAGSSFTTNDAAATAKYALNATTYAVNAIEYTATVSANKSTCTLGTVSGTYKDSINLVYQSKTIYLKQVPNSTYEVTYSSTRYYNGKPYTINVNYNTFTFDDANKKASYSLTNCSAITYSWSVSSSNSNYCYYLEGTSGTPSSRPTISKTYDDLNTGLRYKINPEDYFYISAKNKYKGVPYTNNVGKASFTLNDANKTATYNHNCTSFSYTCKPAAVTGGTVSWNPASITYNNNSTYTITASDGYTRPSTYSSTVAWASFEKSTKIADGNATASGLADCTANTYTITLNKNGGTADGTCTATYNSTSLTNWSAVSKTGYTCKGYYTAADNGSKVIDANGTLVSSVSGYTNSSGQWIKSSDVTLYAQWALNTYTFTFSVTNKDYGTYSVKRTPSSSYPGGAAEETWENQADGTTKTIYYGDKITTSHSQISDSAISWDNWPTITAPSVTSTGDATTGNITVTNEDEDTCTLYYNTSNSTSGGTSLGSTDTGKSQTKSNLNFETNYYCYASKTIERTGSHYTYSDSSTYSGTTSVTSDVTATFTFGRDSVADSESKTGYSAITTHKTAAQNKYTVTFSTTENQYGTWGTASIANVPYGTAISRSNNTVTVGNLGNSIFTAASTTAAYNYGNPSYTVPSSVGGNETVYGGCEQSDRTYTINWIDGDGNILETDSDVAYDGTLTYDSSTTPTKSSTAQYTYTFSGWKLGSTTITSGTSKNPGSTTTTTLDIQAQFTPTTRNYTVTFSATNGSWSTASIANVPYGTTWSTSNNKVTLSDNLGSSTYAPFSTTAAYTAGAVSITNDSGTVEADVTIEGSTATTERTYTINWKNGSTVLETDTDVAYDATLTYNGNDPTKSSTDQYEYPFSGWKLGSTEITSGTSKNPGSTSTTTLDIDAQFNEVERQYTVTFSYTTALAGSWDNYSNIKGAYSTPITISGTTVTVGTLTNTWTGSGLNYHSTTSVISPTNTPTTIGTGKTYTGDVVWTPYQYTIREYNIVGGYVYWSTSQITTSGGYSSITADYGTRVYWRIAAATGYDKPNKYYGWVDLIYSNFSFSSTTSSGHAEYSGSDIANCTKTKYTSLSISWSGLRTYCSPGNQKVKNGKLYTEVGASWYSSDDTPYSITGINVEYGSQLPTYINSDMLSGAFTSSGVYYYPGWSTYNTTYSPMVTSSTVTITPTKLTNYVYDNYVYDENGSGTYILTYSDATTTYYYLPIGSGEWQDVYSVEIISTYLKIGSSYYSYNSFPVKVGTASQGEKIGLIISGSSAYSGATVEVGVIYRYKRYYNSSWTTYATKMSGLQLNYSSSPE